MQQFIQWSTLVNTTVLSSSYAFQWAFPQNNFMLNDIDSVLHKIPISLEFKF